MASFGVILTSIFIFGLIIHTIQIIYLKMKYTITLYDSILIEPLYI